MSFEKNITDLTRIFDSMVLPIVVELLCRIIGLITLAKSMNFMSQISIVSSAILLTKYNKLLRRHKLINKDVTIMKEHDATRTQAIREEIDRARINRNHD